MDRWGRGSVGRDICLLLAASSRIIEIYIRIWAEVYRKNEFFPKIFVFPQWEGRRSLLFFSDARFHSSSKRSSCLPSAWRADAYEAFAGQVGAGEVQGGAKRFMF